MNLPKKEEAGMFSSSRKDDQVMPSRDGDAGLLLYNCRDRWVDTRVINFTLDFGSPITCHLPLQTFQVNFISLK
jgi:hypothetical protein